jgi:hypothetical protein
LHPGPGRFYAENPQQALAINFTRQGVAIRSKAARWGLALRGYGYGGTLIAIGQAAPKAMTNRVEYGRGALTEWYINGPLGLEQGFTLAKPPGRATGRRLTVSLALSGDLTTGLDAGAATLTMRQRDGHAVLRFAGLKAYDATGRELLGQFELRGRDLLLQVDDAGAQYPLVIDPLVQGAELTASDGTDFDYFGSSVALSSDGTTVLVGAASKTINGNYQQGAAYVFTLSGGHWTQQQELTASDGAVQDEFGSSAALASNGTTALVGAPYHAVNGNLHQGAAYVFTLSGGSWIQQQELTSPDGAENDLFGLSVALSSHSTTALVGAPNHTVNDSSGQGAAYVFMASGRSWILQQELTASNGTGSEGFGSSAVLSSNRTSVLVGAPSLPVNENLGQGAAYVFKLSGGSWTQQQELLASDGAQNDFFGSSIALSRNGTTALVGAPNHTVNDSSGQGVAYVFKLSGGSWTQQQELLASDGAEEDRFGSSVALSGNGTTALVGAPGYFSDSATKGAAYVFKPTGGSWTQQQELTASDGAFGDGFGSSLTLSGTATKALVGAPNHAVNGNSSQGAEYVFHSGTWPSIHTPR